MIVQATLDFEAKQPIAQYFNTTNLRGDELKKEQANATALKKIVYDFFLSHPDRGYAYCEVLQEIGNYHEGSTKRCLSVLKEENKLEMLKEMVISPYGKPCHRYKLIK